MSDTFDWTAIEGSAEFRELTKGRRRFSAVAGSIGIGAGLLYIGLAGFARDFMGTEVIGSISLAFLGGVALILLTWVITFALHAPLGARVVADGGAHPPGRHLLRPGGLMTLLAIGDGTNTLALVVFAIVLAITLGITYWASKRTSTATEFWAAGRGISGLQNGFAMAGDYLSASTFLGFAGLIFLFGVDGWVGLAAAGASFLPVVLLLAERMRNSGKFTMADVLAFRLNARPARSAAALGTLVVSFIYLVAQMVGAGVLLQALAGIDFVYSVLITGTFMVVYVVAGGMLATTWVQIIKAGLLMAAGLLLTILVLNEVSFSPTELFDRAAGEYGKGADAYLSPGQQNPSSWSSVSFGLALLLGTAGLPHILMRFFTVPDSAAARKSIAWAVALIGAFFLMTMVVGVGRPGHPGRGRRGGQRRRQPGHATAGRGAGRRRRARPAATCSWPSSAPSPSRRSWRWWPAWSSPPPAPWPTTCGPASRTRASRTRRRRSGWRGSPPSASAWWPSWSRSRRARSSTSRS